MTLSRHLTLRLTLLSAIVLSLWSVLFYFAIIDEVNDEVDDSLEDYAQLIMRRALAGEALPSRDSGSNNQYFLRPISRTEAESRPHIDYEDREVYIREKHEYEPARVISFIFTDARDQAYLLEVSVPSIERADIRKAIFYWMSALSLALLLSAFLINAITLRRSLCPLTRLLSWIDAYRLGQATAPLPAPSRIREFAGLTRAVAENAERNELLYEQQKIFVGNASHEMQTPIAICRGRLELLLEAPNLTEAQMEEIIKTLATLGDLSRLNRTLLLLCKIEGGTPMPDIEPISLTALLRDRATDLAEVFSDPLISLNLPATDAPELRIYMSRQLAEVLITNLLKNAFVHNRPGGSIRVMTTTAPDTLIVENTGAAEALDPKLIFIRFYHTPTRRTSTGLGLSLVDAICRHIGATIEYTFEGGMHRFTLRFRSANPPLDT